MRKILEFDEVTSTNDICFGLIEDGETEGIAVVALSQTKGRGRQGRPWISPKNEGLYLSFIIKKPKEKTSQIVPLILALSIFRCVKEYSDDASIKWPNDVLLGGNKVAGCLVESKKDFLVAGVGINLNNAQDSFPEGMSATSIKAASGKTVGPVVLRQKLFIEFESLFEELKKNGAGAIITELKQSCLTLGKRSSFVSGGQIIEAVAKDIDSLGGLIIERPDGKIEVLYTGEISNAS